MRMDRYNEFLEENDKKQTRTNKNQELYTDVYLNNTYVDINNLKEVVLEQEEKEVIKKNTSFDQTTNYKYEEKEYDIRKKVEDAIKNKKDDNIKRSYNACEDLEIASLIASINENLNKDEKDSIKNEEASGDLLSELVTDNDNTKVMPLDEPVENSVLENELEIDKEKKLKEQKEVDEMGFNTLVDESFKETSNKTKIIFVITLILLVIGIIIGFLFYKGII